MTPSHDGEEAGRDRYLLHGLVVDSDLVFAGASTAPPTDRPADVRVRLRDPEPVPPGLPDGEVLALLGDVDGFAHAVVRTGTDTLRFRVPGIVDVHLRGTSPTDVEVVPASADQLGLIEVIASGGLIAVLLEATGVPILHASAVTAAGRAVAIVGHSGRGKSTTSALLCRAGLELVTDDLLRLWLDDDITCARGTTSLRLREKARALAEAHGSRTTSADGRLLLTPRASDAEVLPLTALVFPYPTRDEGVEVATRRLTTTEAFDELLASPRLLGWEHPEVLSRLFATASELARRLPAWAVEVPWTETFPDEVVAELGRQVRAIATHPDG